MSAGSRNKGSGFEREVAKQIIAAFAHKGICATDCYRTPGSGGHRFAKKTDSGDLVFTPRLRKLWPFSVECKFYKSISMDLLMVSNVNCGEISSWWAQANASTNGAEIPLLIFRQNRQQAYAMFPALNKGVYNQRLCDGSGHPKLRPYIRTRVNGEAVYVVRLKSLLRFYKRA